METGIVENINGWHNAKLGDVAAIVGGGTPNTKIPEYWNGGIPWLTPRDLSNFLGRYISRGERDISELGLSKSSATLLPKGTVLLTTRAPVGYLAIAENTISTNQGFRSLIPGKETNNLFLFYLLKQNVKYLKSQSTGTTFGELAGSTLKSLIFSLPPLSEQEAIAEVLSSLDDKIDLLHRQNKTLEDMAQTLFRQWFVEEVDEGWEKVNFSDFFDFLEGPGIRNWQYTETGTRFINIRLIQNGEIETEKSNFVSNEEVNKKYNRFLLKEWDMVVSTSGTLGKTAIIRKYHLPLLLNTSVIRFRPKDGDNYSFMYQYLKSRHFQENLQALASGSVQKNFGPIHLRAMKLKLPPKQLLKKFSKQANSLYKKINENYLHAHTLEKLRDILLPKLMSGSIKLKGDYLL